MKKTALSILVALVIIVVGLTAYLAPNDLAACTDMPTTEEPCHTADAIVAVSGGDTTARTQEAIKLYNNGWAPKLIFSGAAQDKTGPSNAEVMRLEAQSAGVPRSDIIIEEYGTTTKENAEKTDAILAQNGIKSVILVTSAYHQRRAALEFNARSGAIVRNHPVPSDNQWSNVWWATPIGWFLAISEFVKIIAFYLGGSR